MCLASWNSTLKGGIFRSSFVKALGEYNTNELDPNLFNDIVDAVRSICDKYAKKYEDAMDKALKEQSEEKEV